MTGILTYLILHYALCVLFFLLLVRPVFLLVNRHLDEGTITGPEVRRMSRHGLKTDLAASAYLTGIPLLVLWAHAHAGFDLRAALIVVDAVIAVILASLTVADNMLYGAWRFRIDSTIFGYLRQPKGAFASVTPGVLVLGIAGILAFAALIFAVLYGLGALTGVFGAPAAHGWQGHLLSAGAFVLGAAVIFALMRGLKHRPNSPYMVYYSTNMLYNHAAVNPLFNIIFTLTSSKKSDRQFMVFDPDEVKAEMQRLIPLTGTPTVDLLKTRRPKNIVFVIWESLSGHFVKPIGGKGGVTEHFDRLCSEGVLFTRVDAGSYRTDPALICTLSGYPGHPTTSIMRNSHALPSLPSLPRALREAGYHTSVLHGGDVSILHMIDYFLAVGFERVTSLKDMPADAPRGTWGVHDNYMFDRLYDELTQTETSSSGLRFITFLTLSSHQPYKVPYARLDDEIENAFAFTDEAFGHFIERLKASPVWDDTLVVALGDHGIGTSFLSQPRHLQPHIPVLLLGGAVKTPMRIDTLMAQTDLAATLLGQMGLGHEDFTFSRDVLADTYTEPWSIHSYNNGFLCRDLRGYTDYDNVSRQALAGADERRERLGRMFMQYFLTDLAQR